MSRDRDRVSTTYYRYSMLIIIALASIKLVGLVVVYVCLVKCLSCTDMCRFRGALTRAQSTKSSFRSRDDCDALMYLSVRARVRVTERWQLN